MPEVNGNGILNYQFGARRAGLPPGDEGMQVQVLLGRVVVNSKKEFAEIKSTRVVHSTKVARPVLCRLKDAIPQIDSLDRRVLKVLLSIALYCCGT